MTREEAKKYLPIIQAYIDGKQVQWLDETGRWQDANDTLLTFYSPPSNYRIKPEPKYRPFRTQEECWNEMHKHPDFGWVKDKEKLSYYPIQEVSDTNHYRNLLNDYEFTDGTPFGIREK